MGTRIQDYDFGISDRQAPGFRLTRRGFMVQGLGFRA
jgi:hypothetical protein